MKPPSEETIILLFDKIHSSCFAEITLCAAEKTEPEEVLLRTVCVLRKEFDIAGIPYTTPDLTHLAQMMIIGWLKETAEEEVANDDPVH